MAIPARKDVTPKEGDSQYGDVPFADPVNKKYPIDTEEHIRAAWNYINKSANAGKYPGSAVNSIKTRIIAAWRKTIDKAGPPSASMTDLMADAPGTLRKQMVVAKPIGKFENGADMKGKLTKDRIRALVENQAKHPRQIPIFSDRATGGDHPSSNDMADPTGWAEGLSVNDAGELVADAKLFGQGAQDVGGDVYRGASIYTVQGKAYDGTPIGEVLKHILLTNEGFIKDLNVAASRIQGDEEVVCYFTALSKEAAMAEPEKTETETADLSLTERLEAAQVFLTQKDGQIRELAASNANLLEEVKAFKANPQLEIAMRELKQQKRINLANKVRFITARMAADRQIDMEVLRGWYDHDSDEVVLAGFTSSQFKGNVDLLQYHRDSVTKRPGRSFISGADSGDPTGMTAEQREIALKAGKDPEMLAATAGAKDFTDYLRRKKAAGKGK